MPFKFRHLCDLLQSLDDNRIKKVTYPRSKNSDIPIIVSWFNKHDRQIPRCGKEAVAFLSCLFPERRADRVYNVQEKRLEKIIGRSLGLGRTRVIHLSWWRTANGADFAQTVQKVMSEAEFDRPRPQHEVTLEEIDNLFDRIAAMYGGSAPGLQERILDPTSADEALQPLFPRLQSYEAKWLVRMFLKRYTPVELPERLVMRQFHRLLPDVLRLQNCLTAAINCLNDPAVSHISPRSSLSEEQEHAVKVEVARHLKPQVGIMVQQQSYDKARSIQHCCDMATRRRLSLERKYDGEYCQIHIDVSKGKKVIKIFSKSGKDSTDDRVRLHGAIENALKLGKRDCPVKKQCILEGELLIWHEGTKRIQPFEKIRKHVTRNGRFLGNDQDSPRDLQERVMIMFYDLLLYDDIVCLNESLEQRRSRLRTLVRRVPGQAELGYREKINFASSDAKSLLRLAFARCISKGWEGFVLKGCDDPYFSLTGSPRCIKLKKDYITGLGDMADLAVVGGRRIARDEQALNIGKLSWTVFYLACLENREEMRRFSARPKFRIVGVVSAAKKTLSPDRTRLFNRLGQFERIPYASVRVEMEVIMDQKLDPPTELFKNPFVVEVVGGGFEKPANVSFHSLRFPRVTKVHEDRSCHDVMSFDELQELAEKAQAMATNEDSQEDCEWIDRLTRADPRSNFVTENSAGTTTERNTSIATINSHTPNAGRSCISPLLVRIDTQEMTEEEHRERALTSGSEHSSVLLPAVADNGTKRKRVTIEQSPTANMSTKRLKLSPQHSSFRSKYNDCIHEPDLPARGLQLRRPFSEVQNRSAAPGIPSSDSQPSPELGAGPSPYIVSRLLPHPPNKVRSHSSLAAIVQDTITKGPAPSAMFRKIPGDPPLPTPPISSAEKGRTGKAEAVSVAEPKRTCTTLPDDTGANQNLSMTLPHAMPSNEERQPSSIPIMLQGFSSIVYLPPAVATKLPRDQHELISQLANAKASFTFSAGVVLDSIERSADTSYVVIVDVANAEDTGRGLDAFHQSISRLLKNGQGTGEGRLIFLDWKVLQHWGSKELSTTTLESYFGGCLAWESGFDAAGERTWEVNVIWDWAEVLDIIDGI
ncbi:hypothetical protein EPUS_07619 [Endocarpon pusillum Z07020]|uniref:ATP-dependent DNA ligase family profile domain-containing protein n=1 Tax=Endocarpon pusillum (strain Z07020 / HMAS-L-300199) TaxID=1263415 RepID=U1HMU4_ENDPU|nr:uncharacterized protein EPUS_07619 [Endocarpon pusillum Z07020]ERF70354.1 hypothetical protein EPUS_07619 [Endocarpon pusillum Z07020]